MRNRWYVPAPACSVSVDATDGGVAYTFCVVAPRLGEGRKFTSRHVLSDPEVEELEVGARQLDERALRLLHELVVEAADTVARKLVIFTLSTP